jgi:hypothetical protein
MQTHRDLLVLVEEKVPGFGGMFLGDDGRLAVYLRDPKRVEDVHAAIESVFGPSHIPAAGIRAVRGRYSVSQLIRWSERANQLLETAGVAAVGLDEARNRVLIGLENDFAAERVKKTLAALGIPHEAVRIEVLGQIRQMHQPRPKDVSAPPGPDPLGR